MAPMQPTGRRETKKLATRVALRDTAVSLFLDQGYEHTTVDQIARTAGVSPRTFFRYFATKDDILFSDHATREAAVRAFMAARPGDEPISASMRAVVEMLCADLEAKPEVVSVQTQLWFSAPKVALRFQTHHEALLSIIAEHVAGRLGVDQGLDLRPRMVAGTAVRAWLTATRVWTGRGEAGRLTPLALEALEMVTLDAPGLD